eukprot:c9077_g2_i1.p1 GENE.c9077_g2_i1~~c9077_g2_i1.p1  ORF type:complete len:419 (-),score=55.80 c9077_g2_i1:63-1280(-)
MSIILMPAIWFWNNIVLFVWENIWQASFAIALYSLFVWFFFVFLDSKKKVSTTTREAECELWPGEVTMYALLEIFAFSPNSEDRLEAARQTIKLLTDEKTRTPQLSEFLRARGERVISWLIKQEIPVLDSPNKKEIIQIVHKLSNNTIIKFFQQQFEDGVEVQKTSGNDFPTPADDRIEGRWRITNQSWDEKMIEIENFRQYIPVSEIARTDPRPKVNQVLGKQCYWAQVESVLSSPNHEPCVIHWGGSPSSPIELWGQNWAKPAVRFRVTPASDSVAWDSGTFLSQASQLTRVFGKTLGYLANEQDNELLLILGHILAVPASWDLEIKCSDLQEATIHTLKALIAAEPTPQSGKDKQQENTKVPTLPQQKRQQQQIVNSFDELKYLAQRIIAERKAFGKVDLQK